MEALPAWALHRERVAVEIVSMLTNRPLKRFCGDSTLSV